MLHTQLHWNNLFWYFVVYGVITWLVMRFIKPNMRKKILTSTPAKTTFEKLSGLISRVLRLIAMLMSIIIPINIEMLQFFIGTFIYFGGLILTTLAIWQYAQAELDSPITNGLYKISRHPMQVMFFVMLIGIALVANNWLYTIIIAAFAITSYPLFIMQERFCIDRYGKTYIEYMQSTPRIILFNSKMEVMNND